MAPGRRRRARVPGARAARAATRAGLRVGVEIVQARDLADGRLGRTTRGHTRSRGPAPPEDPRGRHRRRVRARLGVRGRTASRSSGVATGKPRCAGPGTRARRGAVLGPARARAPRARRGSAKAWTTSAWLVATRHRRRGLDGRHGGGHRAGLGREPVRARLRATPPPPRCTCARARAPAHDAARGAASTERCLARARGERRPETPDAVVECLERAETPSRARRARMRPGCGWCHSSATCAPRTSPRRMVRVAAPSALRRLCRAGGGSPRLIARRSGGGGARREVVPRRAAEIGRARGGGPTCRRRDVQRARRLRRTSRRCSCDGASPAPRCARFSALPSTASPMSRPSKCDARATGRATASPASRARTATSSRRKVRRRARAGWRASRA